MNATVLLVDESRAIRLLGRRVLTSLGFETLEASNAAEALGVLGATARIRAAMIEWNPRDAAGFELLKVVEGLSPVYKPALILCGDRLERSQIVEARSVGADEYLIKPFNRETIRDLFERLRVVQPQPFQTGKSFYLRAS